MRIIDLTGKQFGRWTVTRRKGSDPQGRPMWFCRCRCGKRKTLRGWELRSGNSKSCGCWRIEWSRNFHFKHGAADYRNKRAWTEHYIWIAMRQRCFNKKHTAYARYGGAGIKVCKRWMKFENFIADMGRRPSMKYSLDRYPNPYGNYEPGNVRWATAKQQRHNRRT
jgi:hypothetical protein